MLFVYLGAIVGNFGKTIVSKFRDCGVFTESLHSSCTKSMSKCCARCSKRLNTYCCRCFKSDKIEPAESRISQVNNESKSEELENMNEDSGDEEEGGSAFYDASRDKERFDTINESQQSVHLDCNLYDSY